MPPSDRIATTFVIPVVVSILTVVSGVIISVLLVEIDWKNFILSCILFLIIGGTIYASELYRLRVTQALDVDARYNLLRDVYFSGTFQWQGSARASVLDFGDVIKLEQNAREVWIYAYNLQWEMEDNPLTELVISNMMRGVRYKYIVPGSREVRARVEALYERYRSVKGYRSKVEFRERSQELRLVPFGIVIYNPSLGQHGGSGETVAVCFPYFESVQGADNTVVFLSITGRQTQEIEVQFRALWNELAEQSQLPVERS